MCQYPSKYKYFLKGPPNIELQRADMEAILNTLL